MHKFSVICGIKSIGYVNNFIDEIQKQQDKTIPNLSGQRVEVTVTMHNKKEEQPLKKQKESGKQHRRKKQHMSIYAELPTTMHKETMETTYEHGSRN
jgi:aminoglycoside phosphotransferase family enzyme